MKAFGMIILGSLISSSLGAYQSSDNYYLNLLAQYNVHANYPQRADHYYHTLLTNNAPMYMYPGYLYHLFTLKQFEPITKLQPLVEQYLADHLETQLILAQSLEAMGNLADAGKKFIALSQVYPYHPQLTYFAALAHVRNNNPDEGLALINNYLKNNAVQQNHFIFYFLQAQLYLSKGDKQQALASIQESVTLQPRFEQAWLLLGLTHEMAGNIDEAIKGYSQCLLLVGHDEKIEQQIVQLLLRKKQTQETPALQQLFAAALHAYEQKQYVQALALTNQALAANPQNTNAKLLTIEILCSLQKSDEAITLLKTWISTDGANPLWFRSLHLLFQAGAQQAAIIQTLKEIVAQQPKNLYPILYLSDILLRTANTKEALAYLTKAQKLTNDPALQTKILFQLGVLYYHQGNWQSMHKVLDQGNDLQQNYPPLLNLLAYYYASKGKNLSQAQLLIKNALQRDPNNPHFLDTQALILYKQKNYTAAQNILLTIVQKAPNDYYILKHLGKTLYKTGNSTEARNALQKALLHTKDPRQHHKLTTLLAQVT